jgi:hypothetical protein
MIEAMDANHAQHHMPGEGESDNPVLLTLQLDGQTITLPRDRGDLPANVCSCMMLHALPIPSLYRL